MAHDQLWLTYLLSSSFGWLFATDLRINSQSNSFNMLARRTDTLFKAISIPEQHLCFFILNPLVLLHTSKAFQNFLGFRPLVPPPPLRNFSVIIHVIGVKVFLRSKNPTFNTQHFFSFGLQLRNIIGLKIYTLNRASPPATMKNKQIWITYSVAYSILACRATINKDATLHLQGINNCNFINYKNYLILYIKKYC